MYTENLENEILLNPAIEFGCTSLKIITGYTDTEFISRHLIHLTDLKKEKRIKNFSVDMILGMTNSNGLSKKKHDNIKRLIENINADAKKTKFICRYKFNGPDIHSKVYIWFRKKEPVIAFCGSANYSENAFSKRRECMSECNCIDANNYFKSLISDTILATDNNLEKKIKFSRKKHIDLEIDAYNLENLTWAMFESKTPIDICKISLLKANGTGTGYGSGLNWGIRPNGTKRNQNQAYIPYNKKDKKDGFFPLKKDESVKHNPLFKVVLKDFPPLLMRVAQDGNKGIHSAENNSLLGSFFRQKLGIPNGTYITKEMLENYGKTYVTFKKYDNDVYVMEF